jgi:hypothetical protein
MATRKTGKTKQPRPRAAQGDADARSARIKEISKSSSQIVKDAAVLLDEEIASGIVAAKQVQQRFQKERRIDPGDFKDALTRFQGDAHDAVNLLNDQFAQLRSDENAELVKRFTGNAHSLLDLVVELVNTSAEIADQLAKSNLQKKQGKGNA